MVRWFPEIVSKRAYELALKQNVDLSQKLWPDRNLCSKTGAKSNPAWEHSTPIEELFNSLINCRNIESIKDTLNSYY